MDAKDKALVMLAKAVIKGNVMCSYEYDGYQLNRYCCHCFGTVAHKKGCVVGLAEKVVKHYERLDLQRGVKLKRGEHGVNGKTKKRERIG